MVENLRRAERVLLLCQFYLCKLFAGVDEEGAAKRAFVTGIFAVVLTVSYTLPNLVLLLLGRTYWEILRCRQPAWWRPCISWCSWSPSKMSKAHLKGRGAGPARHGRAG